MSIPRPPQPPPALNGTGPGAPDNQSEPPSECLAPDLADGWRAFQALVWPETDPDAPARYAQHRRQHTAASAMAWVGSPLAADAAVNFLDTGETQGRHALGWYLETRGLDRLLGRIVQLLPPPPCNPQLLCQMHRELLGEPPLRTVDGDVRRFPLGNFTGAYNDLPGLLMGRVGQWLEPLQTWFREAPHPLSVDVPIRLAHVHRIGHAAAVFDVGQRRLALFGALWLAVFWGFPLPIVTGDPDALDQALADPGAARLADLYHSALQTALTDATGHVQSLLPPAPPVEETAP